MWLGTYKVPARSLSQQKMATRQLQAMLGYERQTMKWWWKKPEKLYYHSEWTDSNLEDIKVKIDAVREKMRKLIEEHDASGGED